MNAEMKATDCPHDPGSLQIFDESDLLDRCLGNQSLAERIVQKFRLQLQLEIPSLEQAAQRADWENTGTLAHRLKGSAAAVGAPALLGCFSNVERLARLGDRSAIPRGIHEVIFHWRRFEDVMARGPLG